MAKKKKKRTIQDNSSGKEKTEAPNKYSPVKPQEHRETDIKKFSDFFTSRGNIIIFALLLLLPLIVFWQTTGFDFVWDDQAVHLNSNPYLKDLSLSNILNLWKSPYKGLYIPLSYTVWGLLKPAGQLFSSRGSSFEPFIYHFLNIILHIINGFILFRLLLLIIKDKWAVLAGTLLFLIHPIQAEAVSWVSELRGLLSTALGLISLLYYLKYTGEEINTGEKKTSHYIIPSVLFLLALLSKPSIIVLPLIALLLDLYLFGQPVKDTFKRLLPLFAIIVPLAIITKLSQSDTRFLPDVSLWVRPFIWMDTVNFYLYKIILPFKLAASYARTPGSITGNWWLYIEWIIPASIGIFLWIKRKRHILFGLSFLIFIIGYLPVSGLLTFTFQKYSTVADRYIYLSMTGLSLAAAYGLSLFQKRTFSLIAGAVILFLGIWSSSVQVPTWKDNYTLWDNCIKKETGAAMGYYGRGFDLIQKKKYYQALGDFNRAIEIDPGYEDAYHNRGMVYGSLKEYDRALQDFGKVLDINPDYAKTYFSRGNLYIKLKEYDKAIKDLNRALVIRPDFTTAYISRAILHMEQKNVNQALMDLTKAIETDPSSSTAYMYRGQIYLGTGRKDLGMKDIKRAKELGFSAEQTGEKEY